MDALYSKSKGYPSLIRSTIGDSEEGYGRILQRNPKVPLDEKVAIRFQFDPGKAPIINIYDPRDRILINTVVMKEAGTTGIYTYEFDAKLISWAL